MNWFAPRAGVSRRLRPPSVPVLVAGLALLAALPLRSPARLAAQWDAHPVAGRATVEERPGRPLPLELAVTDERGRDVPLGHFFRPDRPVLIVPGYHECPMLCPLVLEGLRAGLGSLSGWEAGADYLVVALSVDPGEGPREARRRRAVVGAPPGWHFVTGAPETLEAITDALGFRYGRDETTGELAHVALVVAATPDGRVGRYVYGVSPGSSALQEALSAAATGRAAGSLEQVLVRCFRFLPALQRHAAALAWFLKLGGLAVLAGLAGVFVLAGRRALAEEAHR